MLSTKSKDEFKKAWFDSLLIFKRLFCITILEIDEIDFDNAYIFINSMYAAKAGDGADEMWNWVIDQFYAEHLFNAIDGFRCVASHAGTMEGNHKSAKIWFIFTFKLKLTMYNKYIGNSIRYFFQILYNQTQKM